MRISAFWLCPVLFFPLNEAFATTAATGFNYDIDAAMTYIDALSVPKAPGVAAINPMSEGPSEMDMAASAPRTLGLRRVRLGLDWEAPHGADLHLVLRPDAVNRQEATNQVAREFDSRAGDLGMQPTPEVRLLDAYQIGFEPASSMRLAVGVWEGFETEHAAYPEVLAFGLGVLYPAKFSAVRLDWHRRGEATDSAAELKRPPAGIQVSAYVFKGDDDRGESLGRSSNSYDNAPVARDSHDGSALALDWGLTQRLMLAALAGYDQTADPQGSYDDVFGQLSLTMTMPIAGRDGKVSADGRYRRNKGHGDILDQSLQSVDVTASIPFASSFWGLVGVDFGKGDRWAFDARKDQTVGLSGYQLEAGVLNAVGKDLYLQFMVTHEYRQMKDAQGHQTGGFIDTDDTSRSSLRRAALELTYRLNQNA